ncbi:hypothetical protein BpHYR1_034495 [Brachionus plicatilis]|uniref:Uncharacterized protein n=1 Tax=Brachionus plicatilis TaxID=10195 RepID=A0A3M7RQ19_BRAPC|nr:hypothetical protein BpHYR1_034495 [Brachionus plicatilis]
MYIGLAVGFGSFIGLMVVLCLLWNCFCGNDLPLGLSRTAYRLLFSPHVVRYKNDIQIENQKILFSTEKKKSIFKPFNFFVVMTAQWILESFVHFLHILCHCAENGSSSLLRKRVKFRRSVRISFPSRLLDDMRMTMYAEFFPCRVYSMQKYLVTRHLAFPMCNSQFACNHLWLNFFESNRYLREQYIKFIFEINLL